MNKRLYLKGEQVLYKKLYLAYPAIVVSDLGNEVEIALSPEGNLGNIELYNNWDKIIVDKKNIKSYLW